MKIVVCGLWHLGCVTAACAATRFDVVGLDFDDEVVGGLKRGEAPILEPGLNELIAQGLDGGSLSFTSDPEEAGEGADVLWLCYDTPVDDDDVADVDFVLDQFRIAATGLAAGTIVLISSQLPAGTCALLEKEFPDLRFACSPENLRLGKAIDAFTKADRAIVGIREESVRKPLEEIFSPFAGEVIFMRTESAEMVKHALNSFLAVSITFINEIARLCELTGADASEVSAGLKSDVRIGRRAYLGAGGPFAGGTLARDVVTLTGIAEQAGETLEVIPAIKKSNDRHRGWALGVLNRELDGLSGRKVAVLGLTYTPNTNTLRRSAAMELCRGLLESGADVVAYDPVVKELPSEFSALNLAGSIEDAVSEADAVVVCTRWPDFQEHDWEATPIGASVVIDADRFLESAVGDRSGLRYISVGNAL